MLLSPPYPVRPQITTLPSLLMAAYAISFPTISTTPDVKLLLGTDTLLDNTSYDAPFCGSPQTTTLPSVFNAAALDLFEHTPTVFDKFTFVLFVPPIVGPPHNSSPPTANDFTGRLYEPFIVQ